jgi:hypothetical protein
MSTPMIVPASERRLEAVLRAQMRLERCRAARELLLWLLALEGAIAWLHEVGTPLPSVLWEVGAVTWPVLAAAFTGSWIMEVSTGRRVARLIPVGPYRPGSSTDGP